MDLSSLPPSSWLTLAGSILTALLASRVVEALARGLLERLRQRTTSTRGDAQRTLRDLRRMRTAYLSRAQDPHSEVTDVQLADLSNRFFVSAAFTGERAVLQAATDYFRIAELYAAQDPDTSTETEFEAFLALLEALRKYRP